MTRRTLTPTLALLFAAVAPATAAARTAGAAVTTVYAVPHAAGVMVTTGGWAYCEQARPIARRLRYTLLCGRYILDGYTGPGLRSRRRLDWGNPAYLAQLAAAARTLHARVGGRLVLAGVSYSGFGVATLASHHPELRPDALVVVDSYLDLVARRSSLPDAHETAREIDLETGGTTPALRSRSISPAGLARLVRHGTRLLVVWSVAPGEKRLFNGATCGRDANAGTLAALARLLRHGVSGWVTHNRHGADFWRYGAAIGQGRPPGLEITFPPDGTIPPAAVCR